MNTILFNKILGYRTTSIHRLAVPCRPKVRDLPAWAPNNGNYFDVPCPINGG